MEGVGATHPPNERGEGGGGMPIRDGNYDDVLPTERVGIVVYLLMTNRGRRFRVAELAELVSLTNQGMWAMLAKLSRRLPIAQDSDGWYMD